MFHSYDGKFRTITALWVNVLAPVTKRAAEYCTQWIAKAYTAGHTRRRQSQSHEHAAKLHYCIVSSVYINDGRTSRSVKDMI